MWYSITSIEGAAEKVKALAEDIAKAGFTPAEITQVFFEFIQEYGVYGYCEDCEERASDEPPMRDESRD